MEKMESRIKDHKRTLFFATAMLTLLQKADWEVSSGEDGSAECSDTE